MRRSVVFLALGLLLIVLSGGPPAGAQAGGASDLSIRVLARVSSKFVSSPGSEPPGFDVDLLRRFAVAYKMRTGKEARLSYTYSPTVPALLEAVQKGTADVGCGGVTATAERAKSVDFSVPTLPVRSVLVAPASVLDATSWRQKLKGLRLGTTVGSTNAAEAAKVAAAVGGVRLDTSFKTNEALFAALVGPSHSLDAAIVDLPQYWTLGKTHGIVLVDSVGEPQGLAFVLRKGSPLKAPLDQFLDTFTHSSDYFQLIRRYFGQDAEQMVRMSRGGGK
ncbi:MAG TPA: transporter substrate-binding domain-containing protein [Thermoanaerobaculia bacterium]|jgi:ABC-type amino acid transport substrate-binding protein|nr:transporter substrate-binding domain-containing protein [Thermoanaerobaculia bacterium]